MLSTPAKVGIVTILGLVMLGAVIVWKSDILLVGRGYRMIASFDNIEGLTVGSEVRFRGLKAGKIVKIDPGPYDIKVYSMMAPGIKIPADSTLRVAFDGIVGMKFLEIRPGTAEAMYAEPQVLYGIRTAAIVDFVDIGSKNLEETKAILITIRRFIENPELQRAFSETVINVKKTASEIEKLTEELRATNQGIMKITTDPKFQESVKGTVRETEKTLSSANRFFEGAGKLNVRSSGGVDVGTRANAVRGDIDIIQSENNYLRLGFGEGPTRTPGILDVLVHNRITDDFAFRLGVINSQLGGGVVLKFSPASNVLADIYDINNPRPNWPRVRLGYQHQLRDYLDMMLQADDVLNSESSNVMLGVRVKPLGEKLY